VHELTSSVVSDRAQQRREARDLLTALKAGSTDRVRSLVSTTFERSGSLLYVVSHLVDTARAEVEDMWFRGELGFVEVRQMMRQLEVTVSDFAQRLPTRQVPTRQCSLISTDAISGEICKRLLEEDGWKVKDLEPSETAGRASVMPGIGRRLVVLVGDAGVAGRDMRSAVSSLQALGCRVLVVAAGHWAQAGHWQQLGADACASDGRTMLLLARKLHSAESTFSISEVARTIRVTPHTIRAWERRYNLPGPVRDKGAPRRYSVEDVQLLIRVSHVATVHGNSLRLASLKAQGLLLDYEPNVRNWDTVPTIGSAATPGQEWRRVADAVPELMMLVDREGTIVDCNIATARMRDTVRENIRGTRLTDLVIDYDRAKAVRLYRPALSRRDAWELRLRSADDNQEVVAFDSRVVAGDRSELLGLIGRVIPVAELASAAQV